MVERRDSTEIIELIRDSGKDNGGMNQRLMSEMKATIQAEIKVVATMVSGLKDKVFEFGRQLAEIRHTHENCQVKSISRSEKNSEQIQEIKLTLTDLKHADISPDKMSRIETNILDLKEKLNNDINNLDKKIQDQDVVINILRKVVYILTVAFGTALAKIAIDIIFKTTIK